MPFIAKDAADSVAMNDPPTTTARPPRRMASRTASEWSYIRM